MLPPPQPVKPSSSMSIFVIDEHPLMREAIAATLKRISPAANVIELGSVSAAGPAADEHGLPDLICVELLLGGSEGVSTVQQIKQQFGDVPIVVLSGAASGDYADMAIEAGATAYLHKSESMSTISATLRECLPIRYEDDSGTMAAPQKLSKRQKQLLVLLDKGMSNRDIAESLDISEHTVKVHLWRLFRRLKVKSRSQASHLARTHGLLAPRD